MEAISDITGINWFKAETKKVEYGCNIDENAEAIVNSLESYKSKDFLPMAKNGIKYGASRDFNEYRIKGYNKTFEVRHNDKVNLHKPSFRWEVAVDTMRCLEKKVVLPLIGEQLLTPETLEILAKDAVDKYDATVKRSMVQLHQLGLHEKSVIAIMQNAEIREDVKRHHKETFKKYKKLYGELMANNTVEVIGNISTLLNAKFEQLIYGTSSL